ncbi:MAG: ATP-binding protein [Methanomassiliicoccaceae archaeon]|nr:ATP-binding protein [Methanomassiliicoccaceae archaeon]
MTKNLERNKYLDTLFRFKDIDLIKIITGIRRCGKSTVMEMFKDRIIESGVPPEKTLHMRFDHPDHLWIEDYETLLKEVKNNIELSKGSYIFFDEIQNVEGWEKAVGAMYALGADIYITGSNARLMSSEFTTHIAGRYVEIKMHPLSFREYVKFGKDRTGDLKEALDNYKRYGGFPIIALFESDNKADHNMILSGIYDTVFLKDVIERNEIRDIVTIKNISRFLMKNIGNQTSVRSISNYITSKGGRTHPMTADTYIHYLETAYLVCRGKKYDIKAKEYLRTADKFYAADLGIRNNAVGYNEEDRSGVLENLVFLELLTRGKEVVVGQVDGKEIDFIVKEEEFRHYYQVIDNLYDEEVKKREIRSLLSTGDNHPKTIITNELYPAKNIEGIKVVNILDFLLEEYE